VDRRAVVTTRSTSAPDLRLVEPAAHDDTPEQLSWVDVGSVCEGLAFAIRPLHHCTEVVTQAYDLGPRGAWMLNLVSTGVCYPLQLAQTLCCGRSLITAELARLIAAGLVETSPGEKDRRRTRLALTPLGEAACQKIRDAMWHSITTNLAGYSVEEVRLLARMLRDVRGPAGDGRALSLPA
jgi:DNA-binding MarR family transcriptional regulator